MFDRQDGHLEDRELRCRLLSSQGFRHAEVRLTRKLMVSHGCPFNWERKTRAWRVKFSPFKFPHSVVSAGYFRGSAFFRLDIFTMISSYFPLVRTPKSLLGCKVA